MDNMKFRTHYQPFELQSEEAQIFFRDVSALVEKGEMCFSEIFTATIEYLLGLPDHPVILHDVDQLLQIEY